jgi:glycogen operon protein
MDNGSWQADWAKSLGVFLNGRSIDVHGPRGEHITDDSFYVLFNGYHETVEFQLLPGPTNTKWIVDINTAGQSFAEGPIYNCGDKVNVEGRSVIVLRSSNT